MWEKCPSQEQFPGKFFNLLSQVLWKMTIPQVLRLKKSHLFFSSSLCWAACSRLCSGSKVKKLHLKGENNLCGLISGVHFVSLSIFDLPVDIALDEISFVLFHVLAHLLPGVKGFILGVRSMKKLPGNNAYFIPVSHLFNKRQWWQRMLTLSECWTHIPDRPTSLLHNHGLSARGLLVSDEEGGFRMRMKNGTFDRRLYLGAVGLELVRY